MQVANFLSAVLDSHADLVLSAHYGGDFVTSAEASSLVQLRNRFALKSTQRSKSEQLNFVELTLPNMPTVAEAIDGGEVSFSKFMEMLSRSRRFKSWLHGLNPDKGLVREYLDASIAPDWIETKTAKVIRYTLGIAAEALDSRLGSAVGLADSFLLDKLATGWRPNHFIDKHLRPLVSGEVA